MKITILIKSYFKYNPGGSEHQGLLFAQEMVERGHEVHYIFVNSLDKKVPAIHEGVNLHPLKPIISNIFIGKPLFFYKKTVIKLLDQIRPDVIYHRNLNSFLGFACIYAKNKNCKTIWAVAAANDVNKIKIQYKWNPFVSFLNNRMIKYGIRNVNHIITQEKKHNRLLSQNFGKNNTIQINKFFPISIKHKKSNHKIKIFWIGNIRPIKQVELFIDLASSIIDDKIGFIIIGKNGTTRYHKSIEQKISNNKLNIKYMGEQPFETINSLLNKGHILINTSKTEGGAPVTFLQAWMNSMPIISLNHNPDQIITKNKIGFHSKNKDQLIKDVMRLSKDHILRNKMGEFSRNYATKYYSMKNIDKIEALFNR